MSEGAELIQLQDPTGGVITDANADHTQQGHTQQGHTQQGRTQQVAGTHESEIARAKAEIEEPRAPPLAARARVEPCG